MSNIKIKLSLYKPKNSIKYILLFGCIALLSACGIQVDDSTSVAAKTSIHASTATSVGDSKLLASLAASYPNGKLPADRAAQAEKDLGQNPAALLLTAETPEQYLSQNTATSVQPQATAADFQPVQRIQNASLYGAYFFSIYPSEVSSALSTHPNWRLEGPAFWASLATGTSLYPVHRFQNKLNGSYLYTIYDTERADIVANYAATFAYEGVAWYAQQTPGAGWSPLYRFRNKTNGTYLFSAYESEKDAIVANYPDVFALEGIGYYVRQDAPVDVPVVPPVVTPVVPVDPVVPSPTITSISPTAATLGQTATFNIIGANLPLTATLAVQDAVCQMPTGNTSSGFSQICTLGGSFGSKLITVKKVAGGALVDATRHVNVTAMVAAPTLTGALNDTGLTSSQCYQAGSNTLVSCVSVGAQALNNKQDGMVGRDITSPSTGDGYLGFSFSEVSNPAGGNFARTDCVKDNVTGLIWEGKPVSGSRVDSIQVTNLGNGSVTDASGYVKSVNDSYLCGANDWRLPTRDEMHSLLIYSQVGSNVAAPIDENWFPNTVLNTYWTSTHWQGQPSFATWGVAFFSGVVDYRGRTFTFGVRLVRGVPLTKQYAISSDGQEVTDIVTGLIWKRCSAGMSWSGSGCTGAATTFTQEAALAYAQTQTGWRLPNVKELSSLIDASTIAPAINLVAFPSTPQLLYWTSSPNSASNNYNAWYVNFSYGFVQSRARTDKGPVRLVR